MTGNRSIAQRACSGKQSGKNANHRRTAKRLVNAAEALDAGKLSVGEASRLMRLRAIKIASGRRGECTTGEAWAAYEKLPEAELAARTQRAFMFAVQNLAACGEVSKTVKSSGRYGRTSILRLTP